MKLKRKKVKGMTLVEIIISLFVFAVSALVMVEIGRAINVYVLNSHHVDRKVSYEAPLAENGSAIVQTVIKADGSKEKVSANPNLERDIDNLVISVIVDADRDINDNIVKDASGNYVGAKTVKKGQSYTTQKAAAGDQLASTDSGDLRYVDVDVMLKNKANLWDETK